MTDDLDHEWTPDPPPLDLDASPAEDLADAEVLLFGLDLADESDRTRARLRLASQHDQDGVLIARIEAGHYTNTPEWRARIEAVGRRVLIRNIALALIDRHDP